MNCECGSNDIYAKGKCRKCYVKDYNRRRRTQKTFSNIETSIEEEPVAISQKEQEKISNWGDKIFKEMEEEKNHDYRTDKEKNNKTEEKIND